MIPLRPLIPSANIVDQTRASKEFLEWLEEVCARLPATGTATFAAATTAAVAFKEFGLDPQPDTNYAILVESPENKTFWVTSKNLSGFILNASAATSATVRWVLVR